MGQIYLQNDAGYILKIDVPPFKEVNVSAANWHLSSSSGVTNSFVQTTGDVLSIGGNFSDHYQAITAYSSLSGVGVNTSVLRYLTFEYKAMGIQVYLLSKYRCKMQPVILFNLKLCFILQMNLLTLQLI
jgi:hypothetical protein